MGFLFLSRRPEGGGICRELGLGDCWCCRPANFVDFVHQGRCRCVVRYRMPDENFGDFGDFGGYCSARGGCPWEGLLV